MPEPVHPTKITFADLRAPFAERKLATPRPQEESIDHAGQASFEEETHN
jgi:hypothetical protein